MCEGSPDSAEAQVQERFHAVARERSAPNADRVTCRSGSPKLEPAVDAVKMAAAPGHASRSSPAETLDPPGGVNPASAKDVSGRSPLGVAAEIAGSLGPPSSRDARLADYCLSIRCLGHNL